MSLNCPQASTLVFFPNYLYWSVRGLLLSIGQIMPFFCLERSSDFYLTACASDCLIWAQHCCHVLGQPSRAISIPYFGWVWLRLELSQCVDQLLCLLSPTLSAALQIYCSSTCSKKLPICNFVCQTLLLGKITTEVYF